MHIENLVVGGFERVLRAADASRDFVAYVAVHDTTLGPGLGSLRLWSYENDQQAFADDLRLAEAMTWKAAAAGLPLGGGMAVVIADPRSGQTRPRLAALAEVIEVLGGSFVAAAGGGFGVDEVRLLKDHTDYVVGLPAEDGGSGDPAPFTALGVVESIKECLGRTTGSESLSGRTFAVQGLGQVGAALAVVLAEAGGSVIGADVHRETAENAARLCPLELVSPDAILLADCDVLVPCAFGAVLNADTIPRLRCPVVAGAANNQLADEEKDAVRLAERGILYAPDFIVNAGGLINLAVELEPDGYRRLEAVCRVKAIRSTLREILDRADSDATTPAEAAMARARERIGRVRKANGVG